ncbi:ABC transporter permease [Aeromicrobium sp.]|uniref:ABC transporter permease n=1 Tax=Aeromicrobium sp. TaxID=1871063 RepID=UPI0028AA84A8|nr:ABC transporter permease [Aeromicrobium sp.]
MSLDLSPAPGAAAPLRRLLTQTGMELRLTLRNGEQLLLTFVIPVLLLVAGSRSDRLVGGDRPIDVVAPGVLALAILSTSFTSLAIATAFERRYGVLKRLGATPLSRGGLLGGKVLAVVLLQLGQFVVLGALALALGWRPGGGVTAWLWLVVLAVLATIAFGGLGLLMAGTLRAEATLALANLVYVLLLVGGGVLLPLDRYPAALQGVLSALPSGALGEGLRQAFVTGSPGTFNVVVLAVWAVVAAAAAGRWFRWE